MSSFGTLTTTCWSAFRRNWTLQFVRCCLSRGAVGPDNGWGTSPARRFGHKSSAWIRKSTAIANGQQESAIPHARAGLCVPRAMPDANRFTPASMEFLGGSALEVAPKLLNALLVSDIDGTIVTLRITEVEAYLGVAEDPGSHAFRGKTERNSSMFRAAATSTSTALMACIGAARTWLSAPRVRPGQSSCALEKSLRAVETALNARRLATGTVRRPADLARALVASVRHWESLATSTARSLAGTVHCPLVAA